ncbi:MAG: TetR/AcrR family transcriptional regulator [Novosphingobium sp.]|nr:TetR/AcrR family transcriptional regulator [Novosphingobium sp.]
MKERIQVKRARAGRPTKQQAEARQAQLLDHALDHFLDKGYEQATIEAIAGDVSMTKRTVYARYPDKASLFLAAVQRAIERYAVSSERIEATRTSELRQTLINIAMLRIAAVAEPVGLKLQRIINTESYRFPEIFRSSYELGAMPTVQFLAAILADETDRGILAIDDPNMAANVFMSMVVSGPVRFLTSGNPLRDDDLHERVAFAVQLFLEGAKPR